MALIAIANADELADGQMKQLQLNGKKLLLCRSNGEHYVVDEMCSHEDYSLYLGCVRDKRIKCSLHGSWFDLASGEALDEPAHEPIKTYEIKEKEGQIWVDL